MKCFGLAQFFYIVFFFFIFFSLSPRNIMLVGMILQIISGCLTGMVNKFTLHIFFRYLAAVFCALMYTPGLMICRCHLYFYFFSFSFFFSHSFEETIMYFSTQTKLMFYVNVTDQQKMLLV